MAFTKFSLDQWHGAAPVLTKGVIARVFGQDYRKYQRTLGTNCVRLKSGSANLRIGITQTANREIGVPGKRHQRS